MRINPAKFQIILVTLTACLFAGSAAAQSTEPANSSSDPNEWVFGIAPYVWATGIKGDVAVFGAPAVSADLDFLDDVLPNLDFGGMVVIEARKGRVGIFLDAVYAKLETDSTNTPGPFFSTAKVEMTTAFVTPMANYRIHENRGSHLDVMGGLRAWKSETELNLSGGLLAGRTFTEDQTWVDPTVGLKARFELSENWSLAGWAIVGGFGVSSDFMWDAMARVGYRINDWLDVTGGYRGAGVDYTNGDFVFDLTLSGPFAGAIFRF